MRKYIILFFSGLLLMLACKKAPEGIIKPNDMANLLVQLHLTDGAMAGIPQIPDSSYKYGMGKFLQIFKQCHTDSAQFRKSYVYYTMHPDEIVTIYDTVLKRLTVKNDSLTRLIAKNNTALMKKHMPPNAQPGKPVAPGVNHPGQLQPVRPALPTNPVAPDKKQIINRMHAHRDSLFKRNLKNTHAVPAK